MRKIQISIFIRQFSLRRHFSLSHALGGRLSVGKRRKATDEGKKRKMRDIRKRISKSLKFSLIIHGQHTTHRVSCFFLISSAADVLAVYITNVSIPRSYVLNDNLCRPLIFDCNYEFSERDVGFVLKWYHNRRLIYQVDWGWLKFTDFINDVFSNAKSMAFQWIPPKRPYFFVS